MIFGLRFKLYREDQDVLIQFFGYFTHDDEICTHYKLDIQKGLFLSGKTGVGKSAHMSIIRNLLHYKKRYQFKSCIQIALEYMNAGSHVMMHYGRNYVDFRDPTTINQSYCFDDLGTEDEVKHYGSQANVMGQIILMRYDLFQERGIVTHFTSNLTAQQVEKHYGERVRSRLREMCNWIDYKSNSHDKRK